MILILIAISIDLINDAAVQFRANWLKCHLKFLFSVTLPVSVYIYIILFDVFQDVAQVDQPI